jgi:hypothetical protein
MAAPHSDRKEQAMSLKLKALSLGLLAMALGAVAVMNASANGAGHFVSTGNTHVLVRGAENIGTIHRFEFRSHGLEGGIVCEEAIYPDYTASAETETSIVIKPTYNTCHTTDDLAPHADLTITTNGCSYRFTVASGTTDATEQTVHLECPENAKIEVHHPNCTITIPPQTINTGVTYKTITEGGIHAITLESNAQFTTEYHGGICIFTGTSHTTTMVGSATLRGFNTLGVQEPVTAT